MNKFSLFGILLFGFCIEASPKPWEPEGPGSPTWQKIHESFVRNTNESKNEIKALFIGASITTAWQSEGKAIWQSYYLNRSAVDYGISGDTTSMVLWRIKNHELDGLKPRVIVLQLGYNDFSRYNPPATDEEIAKGVLEVVKQMRAKCPESKVINIGFNPVKDIALNARAKSINNLMAKSADHKNVYFLDIGPHLVDSAGNMKPGVFGDSGNGPHLTAAGYQIWHDAMKPLFEKLYNQ